MTNLVLAIWLAASSTPLVDPVEQPACREQCQAIYARELAACEQTPRADMCRDEAADRHQECIDRCND